MQPRKSAKSARKDSGESNSAVVTNENSSSTEMQTETNASSMKDVQPQDLQANSASAATLPDNQDAEATAAALTQLGSTQSALALSNSSSSPSARSTSSQTPKLSDLLSFEYELVVRQQPKQARLCTSSDKQPKGPIDPPPVIRLQISRAAGATTNTGEEGDAEAAAGAGAARETATNASAFTSASLIQSPYLFCFASLCRPDRDEELNTLDDGRTRYITGSVVSSLYHLKDPRDGAAEGFFVFPDLGVRVEGRYRLKITLYEMMEYVCLNPASQNLSLMHIFPQSASVHHCKTIYTEPFSVYSQKRYPGLDDPTDLSKSFASQGLKMRIKGGPARTAGRSTDPSRSAEAMHHVPPPQHPVAGPSKRRLTSPEDSFRGDHYEMSKRRAMPVTSASYSEPRPPGYGRSVSWQDNPPNDLRYTEEGGGRRGPPPSYGSRFGVSYMDVDQMGSPSSREAMGHDGHVYGRPTTAPSYSTSRHDTRDHHYPHSDQLWHRGNSDQGASHGMPPPRPNQPLYRSYSDHKTVPISAPAPPYHPSAHQPSSQRAHPVHNPRYYRPSSSGGPRLPSLAEVMPHDEAPYSLPRPPSRHYDDVGDPGYSSTAPYRSPSSSLTGLLNPSRPAGVDDRYAAQRHRDSTSYDRRHEGEHEHYRDAHRSNER